MPATTSAQDSSTTEAGRKLASLDEAVGMELEEVGMRLAERQVDYGPAESRLQLEAVAGGSHADEDP